MRSAFKTVVLLVVVTLVIGCVRNPAQQGYRTDFVDLDKLEVAKSTKQDVLAILGSPSTTSTFGNEVWYYIGTKMQKATLAQPLIEEHKVIIIGFDENEVVNQLENKDRSAMRNIAVAEEYTPTEGKSMTVMEQLLGNLGRFNPGEGQ